MQSKDDNALNEDNTAKDTNHHGRVEPSGLDLRVDLNGAELKGLLDVGVADGLVAGVALGLVVHPVITWHLAATAERAP